ncbi:flagella synthesis protein FlgN [Solemya velesiana gill symbiont]|uniref:Flagellar biosynthesis protein FlgN n=1 Tax=Solemya velesiana gill symbiont TaxID=1918948 RepID=A0A1T2KYA7_9GAMM|nr:flagellar protein FlgN [Solemya velesiana gill symbiont]OOZ37706.1 hypothetical protein BOW51_00795 [Solemya velesiana gill symbiont]
MTLPEDQQQILANILSAEVATAKQLKQLLEREYKSLSSGKPDQILAVARDKETVLHQMQQHDIERERFLGSRQEQSSTILDNLPPGSTAGKLWLELQELAVALHQQNAINGGMVNVGQRHTRQALDILSGKQHDGDTYGPGGEERRDASTDPLAKV